MKKSQVESKIEPLQKLGFLLLVLGMLLLFVQLIINSNDDKIGIYEVAMYGVISFLILSGVLALSIRGTPQIKASQPRTMKVVEALIGPLIAMIATITVLIVLELGARLIIQSNPFFQLHRLNARPEYVTETLAYANADYATERFFLERFEPGNVYLVKDEQNDIILPGNFKGTYINIQDHRRHTTGQPADAEHIVYLFGGSTIFNIEVPDEHTVASNLQILFNQTFPGEYRVENMGVLGLTSGEELKRLQTLSLHEGDIVIFFDGINDIIRNLEYSGSGLLKTLDKSYLYKFFLKTLIQRWIPKYQLPNLDQIQADYSNNIQRSERTASQQGAHFFHFLQPNIYFIEHPSEYEQAIINSLEKDYPGWEIGIVTGYDALRTAQQELLKAGLSSYDLRFILSHENRGEGQEIFFDDVHVNHVGNRIIAEAIFNHLSPSLSE
jgi:lysophospholipase L1-like esterase